MSVQPGPVSPSSIKHIFVDYENVPHFESGLLKKDTVILTLLLGRDQAKQHAALVKKLKENGTVHLIRLASSGKNAVDFALAYYLGREAV
ncbi:MAG TPA: PIN domain-containing protein, partial [Verrucomicrobiales bacterium]|nr:PIN domain-containing protein [Verrucomicrobiales bacterium]